MVLLSCVPWLQFQCCLDSTYDKIIYQKLSQDHTTSKLLFGSCTPSSSYGPWRSYHSRLLLLLFLEVTHEAVLGTDAPFEVILGWSDASCRDLKVEYCASHQRFHLSFPQRQLGYLGRTGILRKCVLELEMISIKVLPWKITSRLSSYNDLYDDDSKCKTGLLQQRV